MGMTIREIQGHLLSCTAPKYRLPLISAVTDAVIEDMKAWQSRSLESLYPIVYLDCIHVKVRDNGTVGVKAAGWL